MLNEKECNKVHNRCDCMNRVHAYANRTVPELLKSLAEGFKLTTGYQLYSKDKDRLQAIVERHQVKAHLSDGVSGRKGSSAYITSDEFDIRLEISDNYPVNYHNDGSGGHTCEYYNKTVYLWNVRDDKINEFKVLPVHTHNEFDAAKREVDGLAKELSEMKSRVYSLKRLIGE